MTLLIYIWYIGLMTENNPKPTSTFSGQKSDDKSGNVNAMLTYLAGWITGLIFLLTEKNDEFVRFNAAQSVIVFGVLNVLMLIPFIGWMLTPLLSVVALVLWIFLMIKAYQNEKFALPVIGEYVQKLMGKVGK